MGKTKYKKLATFMKSNKVIWEGWTVQDFIESLEQPFEMIMKGRSWQDPFTSKEEVKKACVDNQPYYKKHIPEVVNHFCKKYNIK